MQRGISVTEADRNVSYRKWLTINTISVLTSAFSVSVSHCHVSLVPLHNLAGLVPALCCLQRLLQLQGSAGPLTNLAHLAEFHPDLAFQEYKRRQNSAPDNIHTPLKANRQAKLAEPQSSHAVRHPNHQVLQCVSCFVLFCFVL